MLIIEKIKLDKFCWKLFSIRSIGICEGAFSSCFQLCKLTSIYSFFIDQSLVWCKSGFSIAACWWFDNSLFIDMTLGYKVQYMNIVKAKCCGLFVIECKVTKLQNLLTKKVNLCYVKWCGFAKRLTQVCKIFCNFGP